tara:strand:+ start:192 stop:614 length:423 start_codon:yes stop_codon:yes gene_type:complete
MKKFAQLSVVDILLQRMPELHPSLSHQMQPSHQLEERLFNIWKDKKNQLSERLFKKPANITANEVAEMEKAGLVQAAGSNIHITHKGSTAIKSMVLGDDRSSFEDDGKNINYKQAVKNTKTPSKLKDRNKSIENDWWSRF